MKAFWILAFFLISFSYSQSAENKILVLIDNSALNVTHSMFFESLRSKGNTVDVKMINNFSVKLKEYGEFLYSTVMLFCTSEEEPRILKASHILEFFDKGGNLVIAGDIDTAKTWRSLANQLGVDFDAVGTQLVDYVVQHDKTDPSLITTQNFDTSPMFNPKLSSGILYRGVGLSLTIYENSQVYGILKGDPYTLSMRMDGSNQVVSGGNNAILVAALQGRNNARAIITGSLDMFSNELFKKSKGANEAYIAHLLSWNSQKSGVLRISHTMHQNKETGELNPGFYTTYDNLRFEATVEELSDGQWKPHVSDSIMLSFQMMDPYWRVAMKQDSKGVYYSEFKVPEKPGVFQFKIDYSRPGYSFLQHSTKVTVRPFKHNEYPRYIPQAFPYYVTVFGTILAFVLFLFAFIKQES